MKKLLAGIIVQLFIYVLIFAAPQGGGGPMGGLSSPAGSGGGAPSGVSGPSVENPSSPGSSIPDGPAPSSPVLPSSPDGKSSSPAATSVPEGSLPPDIPEKTETTAFNNETVNVINFRGNRKAVSSDEIAVTNFKSSIKNGTIEFQIRFNQSINPLQFGKENILLNNNVLENCKISFSKNSDSVRILISQKESGEFSEMELVNVVSIDGKKSGNFKFTAGSGSLMKR